MSVHRYAAKRDGVEREIVLGLRAMGASVEPVSGTNFPDLVVGWGGTTYLLEVKQRGKRLSEGQALFQAYWLGGPVERVDSLPAALEVLGMPLACPVPVRWTAAEREELLPAPRGAR